MSANAGQVCDATPSLSDFARAIRVDVLRMVHRAKSSHIGSCFSIADLLAVLYGKILNVDPRCPFQPNRDRFILSKGHACAALYAALAAKGFFPRDWLDRFYQDGSRLPGHATHTVPGVEVSTGSLGHGLSIACGMAIAGRQQRQPFRVFALLSDGECNEGSVWEAILFAGHHRLDNLTAIVDVNKIQSLGRTADVLDLAPFAEKWRACRWSVTEIDGHNIAEMESALSRVPVEPGRPSCIIAHTIKGKGVAFMQDDLLWHYRSPDDHEFAAALSELLPAG
jgi:transketolase